MRVERGKGDYGKSELWREPLLFSFPSSRSFPRTSVIPFPQLPNYQPTRPRRQETDLCRVACKLAVNRLPARKEKGRKRTSAKLKNSESEAIRGRARLRLAGSLLE